MRSAEYIEKLLSRFYSAKKTSAKTNAEIDNKIIAHAIAEYQKTNQTQSAIKLNKWRIIMNKPISKMAVAAVFVMAAALSIMFVDNAATPAYAIEDTIRVLEQMQINAIKMSGIGFGAGDSGLETEYEFIIWAKPNEDRTRSKEVRFEVPGQTIIVTGSGTKYRYHPGRNVVYVQQGGDFQINPWLNAEFFTRVKKFAKDWQITYGQDEQTNKDTIIATCVHPFQDKSWGIEFDLETKLPIRLKQWTNANFQGKPQFNFTNIEYNPVLPEGIFEFQIPENAEVIEESPQIPDYLNDPNCGINVDGLTDDQASLKIVEDYWQALIDGNWKYLAQVRPIANPQQWESKFKHNDNWPQKVIVIDTPYMSDRCNIGPVVPCMIEYSDGQARNINLIVKIRNFKGQRSYIIAGTFESDIDFDR